MTTYKHKKTGEVVYLMARYPEASSVQGPAVEFTKDPNSHRDNWIRWNLYAFWQRYEEAGL